MLGKILASRLEQVTDFVKDTESRLMLLQIRLEDLKKEKESLSNLIEIYKYDAPDPFSIKDKSLEDIIKGIPKNVKPQISPELANALRSLELHKKEKAEKKLRKEVELQLREEIGGFLKDELKEEIQLTLDNQNTLINKIHTALSKNHVINNEMEDSTVAETNSKVDDETSHQEDTIQGETVKDNMPKIRKVVHKTHKNLSGVTEDVKTFITDSKNRGGAKTHEIEEYILKIHPGIDTDWDSLKGIYGILRKLLKDNVIESRREVGNPKTNLYFMKEQI